jgi:hypothetical protein
MAYTGTIVTEAEMQFMAGENRDATGDVEANHNYLAFYAEAYLSAIVKYDIVTNWATINAKYKYIFTEWAARNSAIAIIQYNMSGYTSRIEAEDMINVHYARCATIEKLLREEAVQNLIGV